MIDSPQEEAEKSTKAVVLKDADDVAVIGGYAVVFDDLDSAGRDLQGDAFTKNTAFWLTDRPPSPLPVLYDHGLDEEVGLQPLGVIAEVKQTDDGLWVEAQLDRHKRYASWVLELVKRGVLGWSSAAPGHLVRRREDGDRKIIEVWPLTEVSLTPTPAEPRTLGVQEIRRLSEAFPALKSLAPEGDALPSPEGECAEADELLSVSTKSKSFGGNAMDEQIQNLDTVIEQAVERALQRAAEQPVKSAAFAAPATLTTGLGDSEMKAFTHWLRTGDPGAYKMREGAGSEGGYLVPQDFSAQILTKLGAQSIARAAGATIIRTNLPTILVPTEATEMTKFALTGENSAYTENEPSVGQLNITLYKFTKLVKVSEELLADSAVDLTSFLAGAFAKSMAATENYYFVVGSGSGQPQGALTGATLGGTAASASAITPAEVMALLYTLPAQYRDRNSVSWVMNNETEGFIRALTGNPFLFAATPAGQLAPSNLLNKPVYNASDMPTIAAGEKVILLGDWSYYMIAERADLEIVRNPWLYQANGQVGFFAHFRVGAAVGQAGAFYYLQMKSS